MKSLSFIVGVSALLLICGGVEAGQRAGQQKDEIVWKTRPWVGLAKDGLPIIKHDFMLQTEAVQVGSDDAAGKTVSVFELENPGITRNQFKLELKARWESVEKVAYLELWTHFSDGSQFFTRTLSDSGPMQKFTGNNSPRTVWLPFSNSSGKRPTKLVLNVIFEGKGTVILGTSTLTQAGEEIRLPVEPVAPVNEKEIWAAKPWQELAGRAKDIEIVANDPALKGEALKLVSTTDGARTIQFLEIDKPELTQQNYRFDFQIRYENVEKVAFIEMWTHFADGGVYFSRTLADLGPQQKLLGASPGRQASLPFFNTSGKRPTRLVFNLVFNGPGTVWMSRPRFVQFGDALPPELVKASDAAESPTGWWSERSAGIIGGGAGALLGLCGSLVGLLTFLGKARKMALALLGVMLVVGGICLVTGIVSLVAAQPYHIFYPLLLIGAISALLPLALYNTVRARFEDVELARIEAMDA